MYVVLYLWNLTRKTIHVNTLQHCFTYSWPYIEYKIREKVFLCKKNRLIINTF